MHEILWRLRHPHEFFWEPVRKWLFKARQLRVERDYWKEEARRYAGNADFWRSKVELEN